MAQSYSPFPEGKLSDLATTAQESKVVISEKSEQSLKDLAFGSVRLLLLDKDKENNRLLPVNHSISPIAVYDSDCINSVLLSIGLPN